MGSKALFTVKCLLQNRLRFFLTVISIAVGVSSVLIINCVSDFGVSAVSSELDSLGMNGLIVSSDTGSNIISNDDINKIDHLDGVEQVAPVTVSTSKVYSSSAESIDAMIWGIDERADDVVSFGLLYGRFIDKSDIMSNRKVCMLDQSLAVELFGRENIVGKSIDLLCSSTVESFEVIGVVKTGKSIMQALMGNYFPAFLYTPYTSFGNLTNYNQLFLKMDGSVPSEAVTESVKNELTSNKGKITVTDLASQKGILENMLNTVTNILTVIGAVSLLVSGISIMNIMLISVNERTKEIGIKKSIGATRKDIMLDFLMESVIISVTGTIMGITAAIILAKGASVVLKYNFTVGTLSVFYAVIISGTLGIFFGIFPAYKASKFRPVEALRR